MSRSWVSPVAIVARVWMETIEANQYLDPYKPAHKVTYLYLCSHRHKFQLNPVVTGQKSSSLSAILQLSSIAWICWLTRTKDFRDKGWCSAGSLAYPFTWSEFFYYICEGNDHLGQTILWNFQIWLLGRSLRTSSSEEWAWSNETTENCYSIWSWHTCLDN